MREDKPMNRRVWIVIAASAVAVAGAAVAWYLVSPLFIDRTVDEAFAFEASGQDEGVLWSEEESGEAGGDRVTATPRDVDSQPTPGAGLDEVATAADPDATSDAPLILRQGVFRDADAVHRGSGSATIYRLPDGARVLRLEDFSVTNGPDLHVLLAEGASPTGREDLGETVDLGALKGNVGSQNYDLPRGVDPARFGSIVIYCQPFRVVFSVAELH
jgi:hypothetical protein